MNQDRAQKAIESGYIDATEDRAMPPTDVFTGKTYHGLPDVYPFNKAGFVEIQSEGARKVVYRGVSDGSEWHLKDGGRLEIWPGGSVFNEQGTLCGTLEPADWKEEAVLVGDSTPGETETGGRP